MRERSLQSPKMLHRQFEDVPLFSSSLVVEVVVVEAWVVVVAVVVVVVVVVAGVEEVARDFPGTKNQDAQDSRFLNLGSTGTKIQDSKVLGILVLGSAGLVALKFNVSMQTPMQPAYGTKSQDSRVLGILVRGSWFLGPGCIEVQFFLAGLVAGIR
ncbi:hypothetical protein AK812_SmicGene6081 [Symbiodinium microadriaticum]|uniref:Uncharacterized protein n=1 Tax=Symbiodinium microadriaticum TaxID=2951 RepID=A0A1Q9ERZ9_SYMMI|nr:hypothetical protein AK812_SmicGene6081 [Symbiodinium microadriaticum]